MTDYQAAKSRVERFMEGIEGIASIYPGHPIYTNSNAISLLRADLNLMLCDEGGQVVRGLTSQPEAWPDALSAGPTVIPPQVPAIDARTYLMGCALTGLLAHGRHTHGWVEPEARKITDAALAALKGGE